MKAVRGGRERLSQRLSKADGDIASSLSQRERRAGFRCGGLTDPLIPQPTPHTPAGTPRSVEAETLEKRGSVILRTHRYVEHAIRSTIPGQAMLAVQRLSKLLYDRRIVWYLPC